MPNIDLDDGTIPAEIRAVHALALAGDAETPEEQRRLKAKAMALADEAGA